MPFKLVNRNIVVIGEFNAAIIKPAWLVKQKIFGDGPVEVRLRENPGAHLFKFHDLEWLVGHDRLVIRSLPHVTVDVGAKVARILLDLPHTPVTAIGHNFQFESATVETALDARLGERIAKDIALTVGEGLRQATWQAVVSTGDRTTLTLRIVTEKAKQLIDLNFHSEAVSAEEAATAADKSRDYYSRATEVVGSLGGNVE